MRKCLTLVNVIDQYSSGDFPKESQDTAAASGPLAGRCLERLCPEVLKSLVLQDWEVPCPGGLQLGCVRIALVSDER